MRAIIIGAGRGARLMPTTEDAPKCFAEIRGKRILDWTLDALRGGGCTEIVFIGGYRIDSVKRDYPEFIFRENKDWANNNILVSLMCAEDLMDRPFVTSYSDILFTKDVVARPGRVEGRTGARRRHRLARALQAAHPAPAARCGEGDHPGRQGRARLPHHSLRRRDRRVHRRRQVRREGARQFRDFYARRKAEFWDKPYREAAIFQKAYLIHMFQDMIEQGISFGHADTPGKYREIDTQEDMNLAQTLWEP